MQYHCVQCNQVFTKDPSEDKPRCPTCLRQHGLRPVEAEATPQAWGAGTSATRSPRWLPVVLAVVVAGAGLGGYEYYRRAHSHTPGQVPLEPIDADALTADVKVITGKDPGALVQLLAADDKVSAFAKRAAGSESTPEGQVKAIVAALAERRQKQAFVLGSRNEAREDAPLTAAGTLAAIAQDGARKQLYPLEVTALATAALRSLGVPALVAEVYRFPNEHTVVDPTGRLGYHALALPKAGDVSAQPRAQVQAQVFDVYGGRTASVAASDYKLLTDAQALGAAFALRAQSQLDHGGDPSAGMADGEMAIKLSPSSPSVRSVRAALLLATGGIEAGTHELDAAVQLRNDAPRRNNLATLGLMSGNPDAAAKEVAAALAEAPDYALARVTLATIHLMRGEREQARVELEKAERLDPDLALVPQIWAQYYATSNDYERALDKAQEAVRRRPKDTQARLTLARIDRAMSRYDDMRLQAREIMARAAPDQQERLRELLRSMLGPSVFEDAPAGAGHDEAPSGGQDALSASDADSAHELNDAHAPSNPSSMQLQRPGQPRVQLGSGNDSGFKLKLNP